MHCLELATDLTDSEKNYVTAKVKAYEDVGDTPKDAINDIISDLVHERADIVKQIQAKIEVRPGVKPWAKDFPNIISHTNVNKIHTHPDHDAAKAGDMDAAIRLVDDLFNVDKAKELGKRHPGAIIAAVHAVEQTGRNKIPVAYADALQAATGLDLDTDIIQTNITGHTGKNALQRMLARAKFTGKVERGRDYVLLDDVITQGGTLSALKQYIEGQGSNVVEITSLASAQFSSVIAITPETVEKLLTKYGRQELESILEEIGSTPLLEALTQSEGRQLNLYKGPDSLRAAIAKERYGEGSQEGAGALQEPVQQSLTTDSGPSDEIADWIADKLDKAETITWRDLFNQADKSFGGTQAEGVYSVKDAYDAMEIGINKLVSRYSNVFNPAEPSLAKAKIAVRVLKDYINLTPTQTKRTEEMDEFQQFSTPPPLSFVAAWAANLAPSDQVTEPSGGTANIAIMAKNAGAKVTVNELSERRLELLKLFDFDAYYNEDAGQINNILSDKLSSSVVLMNPPFTASAGRLKKGKRSVTIGQQHVTQAAALLEPGGRLVAIMGNNMAPETGAYKIWARRIAQKGMAIRANIAISGQEYKKYGTTWDNQLIILDKTPNTYDIITGKVDLIEDLLPLIEDIRNDRADKGKRPSGKPESEAAPGQDEILGEPGISLLPPTGGLGIPGGPLQTEKPGPGVLPGGAPSGTPQQSTLFPPGGRGEQPGSGDQGIKGPTGGGGPGVRTDTHTSHGLRPGVSKTDTSSITQELDIKAKEADAKGEITDDLYEGYQPERMTLEGVQKHPTPLVQSAAMAAVIPPKPTYKPKLPLKAIKSGKISDIQVEAIVYAGQAHSEFLPDEYRMGYFIGDGTGVGKGREIAGIIWDNWNRGRKKAVWISEKDGLFKDAIRDFDDAGWNGNKLFNHSKIPATQKNKYGEKRSSHILATEGVLFTTYSKLRGRRETDDYLSRFDQIVEWLGEDFDGVIAFDESHNMANNADDTGGRYTKKASLQALAGVELQQRLPKARIVYASATGATEVSNLGYANRLGLWGEGTAFTDKADFAAKMSSGGIAAMEQVARDMKALGVYTARSLSYDGVEQDVLLHELTPKQVGQYNKFTEAWQVVLRNINEALELTGATQQDAHDPNATVNVNPQAVMNAMRAFWGGHQRFFNQIITSFQTPAVLKSIKEDLAAGRSAVVQLTSTFEEATKRALAKLTPDQNLDELDLTPRDGLMQMVRASFPVAQIETYIDDNGNERSRVVRDSKGNIVINPEAVAMRERLLDEVGSIAVPQGSLDMIMDEFGPDMVAEVTGRHQRLINKITDKGVEPVIETWSKTKSSNDAELFMAGKKKILVFSEAGGTGRSYHASLVHKNQSKRVHYLLQAGWRADKAIQGLGRTHRSNQKQPPKYFLVSTDLKGQKRFIATIARRLDQLGALTKGQRETGSSGIFTAKDNLENDYAETALRVLYDDLASGNVPAIDIDDFQNQTGLKLVDPQTGGLLSSLPPMKRFMNRLLSLNVETQNSFFDEFMVRMDRIIDAHTEAGTLDQGLETLIADKIEKVSEEVVREDERTGAQTKYVQLDVTRPNAIHGFADAEFYSENFYRNKRSGKVWSQKRIVKTDRDGGNAEWHYVLKGEQYQSQSIKESQWNDENWDKLSKKAAKPLWDAQVEAAPKQRVDQYHLITGTLLPIWDRLIGHPRIFRIQTEAGERMVGRLIPPTHLAQTLTNVGAEAARIDLSPEQIFEKVLTDGQTITFANEIKLTRRMVSGDERIEITELEYNQFTPLEQKGAFSERIDWRTRFFVPTDLAAGARVIKSILANNPVVLAEGGTTQRSFRLSDKETTTKRGPYNEQAMTLKIKGWLKKAGFDKEVMDRLDLFLKPEIHEEGVESPILGTTLVKRQRAIIELAMAVQDLKTLEKTTYHEAFHLAVTWILPEKDIEALLDHYGDEELAAEAFAEYMAKRSTILKAPSAIRRLLMKIQRALQIIRNGLRGLGFTRPQDVFGQLSAGAYAPHFKGATTVDEFGRYRVRQQSEDADHEKSWAAATMISLKEFGAAFKNPKAGFIEGKADTTVLDRLISTPSHYFKKIGATRRMFEAAMRYPDNQQDYVNAITKSTSKGDFFTTRLEQLKKKRPEEYGTLKEYLVNRDIDQVGHTVKQDDSGKFFTAYDPKGKAVGRAVSHEAAWTMAVTDEFERYLEAGHSEQAAESLRGFRTMMHNGFNILYSNMRDNISRLEALGLPMPEVAVWSGGEKVKVNLKLALDMMGDLRGFYFPRQRQTGRFMVVAVRKSDGARFMDYRDHKTTAQHLVNKMTLKGYKASYRKSKALPEDVFEMARSTVAIQAEINAALERIGAKGKVSLEDFGLKRVNAITDTMKASFSEEEVNEFEKDFLITGPWNKDMSAVFMDMGGKFFRQERIWHFFNPPANFEQRLVKALLHKVDIVDRQMATLFAKSLTEQAANVIKARGHRVHMIQRATAKGEDVWAGYETDPAIASASYAKGLSSGESKRILAGDLVGAMTGTDYSWLQYKNDMRKIREKPDYQEYLKIVQERRIDPSEQKNAFRDAKVYMEDLLRNQEWIDRFIGGVKGVAVLKYLAGRVSAPVVNLTAMVTSVPASMNGFADIPITSTAGLLKDAAKHYTLYKLGRKTEIPPDALLALDHLTDKAWDKSQYNKEAFSVLEGKLKGTWRKVLEYSMFAFGASEQLNRGATILGTYMGIKARGGQFNHEKAMELSRKVSDQAHGVYGKLNYPFMARGSNPAAQLIKSFYVFRTFSHNYLLTMKDLWGHGWKPEHAKAFNYMLISPAIVAGTGATIATPIVSALLKMAGLGGDDPEEKLYNWIGTELGDYSENLARFGMFGMSGISLKGSLQIGITDIPTTIPDVLGAPGSMVTDLYYGGKSIYRGDISKGIEKILPLFAGNVLKGWREGTEGITTGSNAPVFYGREPLVADTVDAILRMLSFNPSGIATIRERQWKERQIEFKYRKLSSDIYAKFKKFYLGDKKDRTKANYIDLISEVRQYNARVKGRGLVERGIPLISKRSIETNLRRAFRPNKRERLRARR